MKPVVFDMDGIVLEGPGTDPQVYADAADAVLAEFDADPTPTQRRELRRHGLEGVVGRCTELGIDPEEFWKRKERHASAGTHKRIRDGERGRYADADAIATLSARTTTALVSNNRHETATFVADYYDLGFEYARGRDPTLEGYRRRKPDPYYLEDALEALDIDDGYYVGDSPKDIVAAREAGLEPVFVRRSHNRDLARPDGVSAEVDSLSALEAILEG
ncbi:HAD family hydrolase [Salinadaptatus halalkaliphilus]|uniref:HAD family hydrolase n=1 Tax=Salinadaptatus halalkaliphilus TaxID=2419781 RepID=A0A4S3TSC1_9EURY|nr:HAD-IA family hydrolase [Salinadaptatus halalkaliphilus]THE66285.1 HAD family hydrolase [Salinadaptatus halalkaliphilus]